MNPVFLSAEWLKILFVNYRVPEDILAPYIPRGTKLDLFDGECLVSLAGFQFLNTRLSGIPLPFHQYFEEFNLRFYVVREENHTRKRGVVFISEFVNKSFFKALANTVMREKYASLPMKHTCITSKERLKADYGFKCKNRWNSASVLSERFAEDILPGSLDEFIAEHYWGYNKWYAGRTLEYKLDHPRWKRYKVLSFHTAIRFEDVYPKSFVPYLYAKAHSVQFIEGSPVRLSPSNLM
ncbi:YqjF family protein [Desertivirga xinjiangensis]|uniref:YqjF family protein n=1 Tax=Desertivirga xinjiangensis TaxID=539206 RepID=UPI00210C2B1B|nr:DUF2071 domain-containing protein [Pedobacter xinjiangensis]